MKSLSIVQRFCTNKNYYQILGVGKSANFKQIKQRYIEESKKHHPDSPTGDKIKFVSMQQAFSNLNDPAKRKKYDMTLGITNSTWQTQQIASQTSQFQNSEIEEILKRKPQSFRRKSSEEQFREKYEKQILENTTTKDMIKGLALPATAFFIFWLLWSVGERVLMNYKGDEDHQIKSSKKGKKFSIFVIELR